MKPIRRHLVIVTVVLAMGCNRGSSGHEKPVSATSASASASAREISSAAASRSASAASSAAAAATGNTWTGEYAAKKAIIEMPEKVKDVTWKRDPGDKNVGTGKISIAVSGSAVTGEASGALGDQVVAGTFDGKLLRATAIPKNSAASDAMTGTLLAEVKPEGLSGTLRCVGPDAVMVREATFVLKPAK